jgi:hypothetical protein
MKMNKMMDLLCQTEDLLYKDTEIEKLNKTETPEIEPHINGSMVSERGVAWGMGQGGASQINGK